jgi:hypothetical protein
MHPHEIRATPAAPQTCPMHFGKLRFTKDTPTATPDINNGTAWLNFDMPNNASNTLYADLIQLVGIAPTFVLAIVLMLSKYMLCIIYLDIKSGEELICALTHTHHGHPELFCARAEKIPARHQTAVRAAVHQ